MKLWHGSVRVRLTLLFGGLFLVAGAALLGITYGLVTHATSGIIVSRVYSGFSSGTLGPADDSAGSAVRGPAGLPDSATVRSHAIQTAKGAQAAENDALLLQMGIALAIMALASIALGWLAAGRALSPLRRITAAAQRISVTNLNERLALDGPDDDLRELADTIDGLFGRLDASLHAQRQFVANASHELRTPLARSRTLLEVALRDPAAPAGSLRAACERAIAAGEEQERLIEALLTLARGQRGLSRREPLDLAEITRTVLADRGGLPDGRGRIAAHGITLETMLGPAPLAGDRALIERAVANLIDNALRYNVADGTVWVTVDSDSGSGRAALSVANTGPAVHAADVDRLLLPFQRGASPAPARGEQPPRIQARSSPVDGLGLGLGLSIVRAIATTHGAIFRITPRLDGGGLTARLVFPAVPAPVRGPSGAAAPPPCGERTTRSEAVAPLPSMAAAARRAGFAATAPSHQGIEG